MTGRAGLLAALCVLPAGVYAQTTDARTISIHEPVIRIQETNLARELVVQIPPSEGRPLELKVGTRVEAARIDATLTNVTIDGVFRGNLSRVLDRLQMRPSPSPTAPPRPQQPVSP